MKETFTLSQNEDNFVPLNAVQEPAVQQPKKVLLAEDDISMRRFLEVVLRRAGYEVLAAEDGAAAMQTAIENKFDVAVLDAMMPNMNGYELCRIFRGHPNWQNIPLVILSGLETETCNDADAYLVKTANIQDELLQVLTRLLKDG